MPESYAIVDEFALIKEYFDRPIDAPNIRQGIGDDCAIISVPEGQELVFSLDTVVAERHFFADAAPNLIAERAVRVALSDLAAMGADALCFTLSLSLPEANQAWLASFSEGLHHVAQHFACPLVGGDTVKGPLVISVQVHGLVPQGTALRRGGAKAGDHIFVSGYLGDGAAALLALQGKLELDAEAQAYLEDRYYKPEPQLHTGKEIRKQASAAIDISDGLLADLGHICAASGLGAELGLTALPYSNAVLECSNLQQRQAWALSGGDDYQLCFTVPQNKADVFEALASLQNLSVQKIGQMREGEGIRCAATHKDLSAEAQGFKHF